MLSFALFDPRLSGRRVRALGLFGSSLVVMAVGLFVLPAPSFTLQKGVVWAPPEAIVRIDTEGDLQELQVQNQERVEPGQRIGTLDNLALSSERASTASRLQALDVQYYDAMLSKPPEAGNLQLEREALQLNLKRLDERLDGLSLQARSAGVLFIPRDGGQPGHFYRQGQELGYILSDHPGLLVKVALTEAQAALVRERTQSVTVLLEDGPKRIVHGELDRETPNITRTLPSPVLGSAAGGPILTDPTDAEGRQTLAPVGLVDVRVPDEPSRWLGSRVWVRFDHGHEPLGWQWLRSLKQAFLAGLGA
jgi:putative peptide zinc metalloprotease protein